jgi:hypothetical protein
MRWGQLMQAFLKREKCVWTRFRDGIALGMGNSRPLLPLQ